MKPGRRGFLKMLGLAPAAPLIASLPVPTVAAPVAAVVAASAVNDGWMSTGVTLMCSVSGEVSFAPWEE